mgnify:CR=1 FL=1
MRYRLYSRLGLPGSTITRIFSLSITTNWLGYILLAGVIFTAGVVELPDHLYVDQTTLRILGIGLLMIIAVYLWFCAFAKHRHMTIKGQKLVLPSWKFALIHTFPAGDQESKPARFGILTCFRKNQFVFGSF